MINSLNCSRGRIYNRFSDKIRMRKKRLLLNVDVIEAETKCVHYHIIKAITMTSQVRLGKIKMTIEALQLLKNKTQNPKAKKMDRSTTISIKSILLEGIGSLRSASGKYINHFRVALHTLKKEINIFESDHDSLTEEYIEEEGEYYYSSESTISGSLADTDSMRVLFGFDCAVCIEPRPFFDLIKLPCSHLFCEDCLVTMITLSLEENAIFPPRCCGQEISLQIVEDILLPELTKTFEKKQVEFNDPNRTYCAVRSCSKYIPVANVQGKQGRCSCGGVTCVECKMRKHKGRCLISQDELFKLAKKYKWQRCYKCKSLVERIEGCKHMT